VELAFIGLLHLIGAILGLAWQLVGSPKTSAGTTQTERDKNKETCSGATWPMEVFFEPGHGPRAYDQEFAFISVGPHLDLFIYLFITKGLTWN
jgi:hypothetical protein